VSSGRRPAGLEVVIGADPFRRPNARLAVALARAGALAVLDLDGTARDVERTAEVAGRVDGGFAVRPRTPAALTGLALPPQAATVVLPGDDLTGAARAGDRRLLVEVTSVAEATRAREAGAAGLIVVGSEAGGRVGEVEAFVLLQQLADAGLPRWVRGGIGRHTAAAAVAAGATGVVLDTQLALVRECELDDATRHAIRAMDGSETRVVGGHRIFVRPDLAAAALDEDTPPAEVAARLGADLHADLLPVGQEGAFAAGLAERHVTAGGVVTSVRTAIDDHVEAARALRPLAPGHGVARANGTRYPIAQGPMTRVSDRAGFAEAVAEGGGLPFLALAVLRGPEVRALLEETAALLGDRPWGVGVLGFVPPELRDEQLREVQAVRPPVALIAGGRPSQAAALEADGIRTYLHAPSPGLIDSFARAGARRFVFEGRECGGHVGPRSSFALWEAAVERLLAVDDADTLELLFAGGIHDALSAAAVAALAAPLAERGAKVGVLMGTGYLFTQEAVAHGAITPAFQAEARACERTVLLETSPGHATRCAETPYVRAFAAERARLEAAGATPQEMWAELEALNLGRLRIASKGLVREGDALRELGEPELRDEGMFMLGQVASLRREVVTVEELHHSVSAGATSLLAGDDVFRRARAAQVSVREAPARLDVAIVGMAAIMPGAHDVEEFWANILAGVDSVTEVPASRWDAERYYDPEAVTTGAGRRTPSKWGGFIPPVGFDALAYGIPPKSLASIDAVQLLSLEVAARALADAGYATRHFDRSRASVIFGTEAGTDLSAAYGLRNLLPTYLPPGAAAPGRLPDALDDYLPELTEDSFPGVLANVIAGRIANRLDLGGVNYTVDAACAASLAALDLACKELVGGTSDVVLCGGADLHNGINDFLLFASVHALSAQGRCRTFDASADGIALGEGVACLVLKRRADAERDGDRIYAVVEAVRGSSDGRALGLTAPRAEGQRRALERAYQQASRSPAGIGLVEAHGTGTVVGDGTELSTLTELFARHGAQPQSCVLGSVKSQIGHTKCTAGLAGLIKAARALYHGVLPPTVGLDEPNPRYDAEKSPFRFNDRARPWADPERRAGVSAFGFGGTNFHSVLSAYDGAEGPRHGAVAFPAELVLVRAADAAAGRARLAELAAVVASVVAADPAGERHHLRDLARTITEGGDGPVQVALVADDLGHLAGQLAALAAGESPGPRGGVFERTAPGDAPAPEVAFLFPGQGSQRVDMLADLFVAFPSLHAHLRAGAAWAPYIYPARSFTAAGRDEQARALTDTRVAQPALGVSGLAMADLLGQMGVRPGAVGGHSYGELVALCVAGALEPGALLALSAARGAAVHAAAATADDPGTMAAVAAGEADLARHLAAHPGVVVANRNGPRQTVVAGLTADVDALVTDLKAAGISARRLPVACAFHSPIVAAASDALSAKAAGVRWRLPAIPVWSNATAARYPDELAQFRGLLSEQVARPVRFVEQVEAMYEAGSRVFVEAGPGRVLTGLVRGILGDRPHVAVATDTAGDHGVRRFLLALAELAAAGVAVDPAALYAGRAERLDLRGLPRPAPQWAIDGYSITTSGGDPVPGGLRPADLAPPLALGPGGGLAAGGNGRGYGADGTGAPGRTAGDVVADYLHNLRETVAAERDVLMRYLDAEAGGLLGTVSPPLEAHEARPVGPAGAGAAVAAGAVAVGATAGAGAAPVAEGTSAGGSQPAALGRDELLAALVDIVAERTGYPEDMLAPGLDLEADLSIDSIKRVEIIGDVAERIGLPAAPGGGLDESAVEELAQLKTLAGIVDWIASAASTTSAPASAAAAGGSQPAALGRDELLAALVDIVAERTGYPEDMLAPGLDLEADLSIDSIKRVEIIGDVAERIGLPAAPGGGLDESAVEELAQLKTLAGIVDWIAAATATAAPAGAAAEGAAAEGAPATTAASASVGGTGPAPATAPSADAAGRGGRAASGAPAGGDGRAAVPERALRCVVEVVDAPALPGAPPALEGAALVVTDDGSGVAGELARRLAEAGATVTTLRHDELAVADDGTAAPAAGPLGEADGVVHVALAPAAGAPLAFAALAPAALGGARWLACVTPVAPPVVPGAPGTGGGRGTTAATGGRGTTAAPSATGGPGGSARPGTGGEAGLLRSLSFEVPDRVVRHIAVDPSAAPDVIAALVLDELGRLGPLDVAHLAERRLTRAVTVTERPTAPTPADVGPVLAPGSVVLLTGGARGITARFAEAFARAGAAQVELVGRTALPAAPEPADLAAATDVRALRAAALRGGHASTPAEVEALVRRLLAERQVRASLAAVEAAGAIATYHRADVRDPDAVRAVVADVYARHGRLDGVLHGAGVIEDRFLRDKTPESYARVYETKVAGARALLDAVRDDVGFVVLFGSVSGVFGNKGQVDYAAANDALDALAHDGAGGRLAGRVLSIDWGPWGGTGMVSDELAREYARRGVGLIDPTDGVTALWSELAARHAGGRFPDAQVVVLRARPEVLQGAQGT
jgi:acyl transferase domain-containing protein/NAD(P)H-dependent flavin oxidoreductase YrpB (nitropropane dioxygenase family)/NAD(P)-dependent dehydrogenase (short-subunit alcohol dehydrogenase family)/acyl carrier protein